jgi:hypothetical protein
VNHDGKAWQAAVRVVVALRYRRACVVLAGVVRWEEITAVATAGAAFVALVTFAYQIMSLRRTLASTTYQELVKLFNEYQQLLSERPELYTAIYGEQPELSLQQGQLGLQVKWVLGILLNWYESAAIQSGHYRAIPADIAEHWHRMLHYELSFPTIRAYWELDGQNFHPALAEWVSRPPRERPA